MQKKKFWFAKILICSQIFHKKIRETHFVHICLICCFQDQRYHFTAYTPLALCVTKQMREICDKNISKENKWKVKKFQLFKMKEMNDIVLGKGSSPQYKGNFVWQKGTWVIKKEVKCEVEYPPHRKLIFSLFNQIKRKLFFQK